MKVIMFLFLLTFFLSTHSSERVNTSIDVDKSISCKQEKSLHSPQLLIEFKQNLIQSMSESMRWYDLIENTVYKVKYFMLDNMIEINKIDNNFEKVINELNKIEEKLQFNLKRFQVNFDNVNQRIYSFQKSDIFLFSDYTDHVNSSLISANELKSIVENLKDSMSGSILELPQDISSDLDNLSSFFYNELRKSKEMTSQFRQCQKILIPNISITPPQLLGPLKFRYKNLMLRSLNSFHKSDIDSTLLLLEIANEKDDLYRSSKKSREVAIKAINYYIIHGKIQHNKYINKLLKKLSRDRSTFNINYVLNYIFSKAFLDSMFVDIYPLLSHSFSLYKKTRMIKSHLFNSSNHLENCFERNESQCIVDIEYINDLRLKYKKAQNDFYISYFEVYKLIDENSDLRDLISLYKKVFLKVKKQIVE